MLTLKSYETIRADLATLPIAQEKEVIVDGLTQERYKAIMVNNKVIDIPSKHYKLIQHEQAFEPILEGLAQRGKPYKYALMCNSRKAWLNVYVGEGTDTIRYGFSVSNSIDRSSSLKYGLKADGVKARVIELVGYRQVCSNGMKIRVPLNQAEFVREEERLKIEELLHKKMIYRHTGNVKQAISEVQYTVEAFLLLEQPLARIVAKAQTRKLTLAQARVLVEKYVGRRKRDKILAQYGNEEQSLWGLYNAITWLASHRNITTPTKFNTEVDHAAVMLEQELKAPASF